MEIALESGGFRRSHVGDGGQHGDDWLDAVEAAEWVGCSVWTIRRWVRDGKLSAWKRVASGTDGRRAVKSFVRRSELDEKFRLDNQAEHVNRIREKERHSATVKRSHSGRCSQITCSSVSVADRKSRGGTCRWRK